MGYKTSLAHFPKEVEIIESHILKNKVLMMTSTNHRDLGLPASVYRQLNRGPRLYGRYSL